MGQKRNASSPDPRSHQCKSLKNGTSSKRARLSPKKKRVSTLTEGKSWRGVQDVKRHSPRFKSQGSKNISGVYRIMRSSHFLESFGKNCRTCITIRMYVYNICYFCYHPKSADEDKCGEQKQMRRGKKLTDQSDCGKDEGNSESDVQEETDEDIRKLDRDLERKSRQHNLTSVNVRNILHEVITNEHVVAMMKTAIIETQGMPMFEPKMTRSKLKEVVEKGVGIPNWNISPIKKSKELKPPQFVDIPLEEDEDTSDEEYCPDEDEEDETAEDTFLESDVESTASSPRVSRAGRPRTPTETSEGDEKDQSQNHITSAQRPKLSRHLRVEAVPMGPPPPPKSSGPARPSRVPDSSFMEKLHAVDEELALSPICIPDLVACRTRSKRPLRDIPLGMLEAELHAPDITPDMYDCGSAIEDKDWTEWLQGLMLSDAENEEEADDDDDPEYNFLEDLDEPDLEDYRTDRAVRITTVTLTSRRFEEPLANMLTACRRTVMQQQRRDNQTRPPHWAPVPQMVLIRPGLTLVLTAAQKQRLQQQLQQVRCWGDLCASVIMQSKSLLLAVSRIVLCFFLFCKKYFIIGRLCVFVIVECLSFCFSTVRNYPLLPPKVAWLFATCPVFLYPELLPHCSLDPALHPSHTKNVYTKGEDCLIVLGLKHFNETEAPYRLICQYLLCGKKQDHVRTHVRDMCAVRAPDNVIKFYFQHNLVPPMPVTCVAVKPGEESPPVEREETVMPNWLRVKTGLGGSGEKDQNGEREHNSEHGGDGGQQGGDKTGGERDGDGEKDGDGERERQGEDEEEEEDFDDLTQDEDEEEVMSSASEESVLSVPELQFITFFFFPSGRGRPPPRSLTRSRRQERCSKDASKLLLLYDDRILDNDPMRESKDMAFAQAYLNRVREALQDVPGKVEEFLSLLYDFDQNSEGHSAVELFFQLKPVLRDWPELLRDFAAFLLPDQALECGLFEEQQAFERSRRFLRQLEISFGENPSHYQKIVRALQGSPGLSPASVDELKAQMASLLKGHTHLQGEFSVFFDELRPPPARPGQFEQVTWPDEGGASGGFEEVMLPDLEEEDELHKIPPIPTRNKKRKKLGSHNDYKECDWPDKDCGCHCHETTHDVKLRKHKRKGCSRCHSNKVLLVVCFIYMSNPIFVLIDQSVGQGGPVWDGGEGDPPPNREDREEEEVYEEEEEWKGGDGEHNASPKKANKNEEGSAKSPPTVVGDHTPPARTSPPSDTPVCARNISLTPSGEKVILWTREADRVILTKCQQQGACPETFQAISSQLGNKTASEVSRRFRDLMRLFHTSAARHTGSEDENTEHLSATDDEQD
uniref:GON-4-like protein n=1 Tax=Denticeps clupeoides TaxID=299321 RepID=A0AAY4CB23_9TELE